MSARLQELEDKFTRVHELAWVFYTRHATAHWLMEWDQLGRDVLDEIKVARQEAPPAHLNELNL